VHSFWWFGSGDVRWSGVYIGSTYSSACAVLSGVKCAEAGGSSKRVKPRNADHRGVCMYEYLLYSTHT
jgi:hypothetical protein